MTRTNPRPTRSQHYVARANLRQFTEEFYLAQEADQNLPHYRADDGAICALKTDGKDFRTGVMAIAEENYFYELRDKAMETAAGGPQAVEHRLMQLEGQWAASLQTVLTAAIQGGVPRHPASREAREVLMAHDASARDALSRFAAFQMIRTRAFRTFMRQPGSQANPSLSPDELDEWVQGATAELILVGDQLANYASRLSNGIWILGINDSLEPLYTSDHPMVGWIDDRTSFVKSDNWFLPKSVVYLVPLSYKVVLHIYERTYWENLTHPVAGRSYGELDGWSYRLSDNEVSDCNAFQRVIRERYLLSPTRVFAHRSRRPTREDAVLIDHGKL